MVGVKENFMGVWSYQNRILQRLRDTMIRKGEDSEDLSKQILSPHWLSGAKGEQAFIYSINEYI